MNKDEVRRELELKLYQWALNEAVEQARQNFPVARQVLGSTTLRSLEFIDTLSRQAQVFYASIMVKYLYHKALQETKHEMTLEEMKIWQKFRFQKRKATQLRYQHMETRFKEKGKAKKTKIKSAIKTIIFPVFGDPYQSDKYGIAFESKINKYIFETCICFDAKYQLNYFQIIRFPEECQTRDLLTSGLDYLILTGFLRSRFDLITDEDIVPTVELICWMICRFSEAVPSLLDGLPVPEKY